MPGAVAASAYLPAPAASAVFLPLLAMARIHGIGAVVYIGLRLVARLSKRRLKACVLRNDRARADLDSYSMHLVLGGHSVYLLWVVSGTQKGTSSRSARSRPSASRRRSLSAIRR